MTSRRPPSRRDPRAEDGAAPPADDLGALRRATRAGSRVPSRPPSSRPGPSEQDFEALRSRYAEAESKRRRAEALADGLAQRVSQLEGEVREGRRPTPAPSGDEARRRLEAKVAELEQALTTQASMLAAAQAKLQATEGMLSASENANAELDERAARARERADAAEEELARFEQRLANGELIGVTAHNEITTRLSATESELATTRTKLSATEAKLGTLQAMAAELDLALQRERVRVAEIEAGHRRVQAAAVSSAREVLSRLERHETKLAGLRKDALSRAISLLDEAGGVHTSDVGLEAGRLTPSVPASRPILAVGSARAVGGPSKPAGAGPDTSTRETAPPPLPAKSGDEVASEPASRAGARTSDLAPTPVRGTSRQTGRNKRTQQGLAGPLIRDALASQLSNKKDTVPPKVDEADVVEITVDDE